MTYFHGSIAFENISQSRVIAGWEVSRVGKFNKKVLFYGEEETKVEMRQMLNTGAVIDGDGDSICNTYRPIRDRMRRAGSTREDAEKRVFSSRADYFRGPDLTKRSKLDTFFSIGKRITAFGSQDRLNLFTFVEDIMLEKTSTCGS